MNESQLPPIEEWWPALSIEARHLVLERLDQPLHERVLLEIERATGRRVPDGARLSRTEVGFVDVQQQPVD